MVSVDISILLDELLLKILSNLPQSYLATTAQVCKHWRDVSYDVTLWKRVVLSNQVFKPGVIEHALERGARELVLGESGLFRKKFQFRAPLYEPKEPVVYNYQLRKLYAHNDSVNEGVTTLLARCRELRTVWLCGPKISDDMCRSIGDNSRLEILYVAWPTKAATFRGLTHIAKGCKRLRRWGTNFATPMTTLQIDELIKEMPASIESTNIFFYNEEMTDSHVAALIKQCPKIIQLNLKHCHNLTEKTLDHVIKLKKITRLDIRFCYLIPYRTLCRLKNVDSLRKLCVGFDGDRETQQTKADYVRRWLPTVEIVDDKEPWPAERLDWPV